MFLITIKGGKEYTKYNCSMKKEMRRLTSDEREKNKGRRGGGERDKSRGTQCSADGGGEKGKRIEGIGDLKQSEEVRARKKEARNLSGSPKRKLSVQRKKKYVGEKKRVTGEGNIRRSDCLEHWPRKESSSVVPPKGKGVPEIKGTNASKKRATPRTR